MIAIVDYDAGNIKSVEKALQYLGQEPVVTRDTEVLLGAEKVIVPGVGCIWRCDGKNASVWPARYPAHDRRERDAITWNLSGASTLF